MAPALETHGAGAFALESPGGTGVSPVFRREHWRNASATRCAAVRMSIAVAVSPCRRHNRGLPVANSRRRFRKLMPWERMSVYESVAVVGATGAVGTIIRHLLEARKFPFEKIMFLASRRSAGKPLCLPETSTSSTNCGRRRLTACNWPSAAPRTTWRADFIPEAVRRGCLVIDESGYWRMDPKVPLVIPEVNPQAVRPPPGHYRQSELLDDANGAGPKAAARRGPRAPRRREHLSSHQRGGSGRQPRPGSAAPAPCSPAKSTSARRSLIASPSTAFRRSARPSTRATPPKK